jgi:cellulose synthase/poly-beta-1,6-N-acetylglucosamine synthase-like glycosyltransferase
LKISALLLASVLLLLVYTWLGYPALLWLMRRAVRRRFVSGRNRVSVSIIVAVHNEESRIASKLEDCQTLDYPRDLLEVLVASDGSSDGTEALVEAFAKSDPRIRLVRSAGRAGKSGVQNLAVEQAGGEILLFTDAETRIGRSVLERVADAFIDERVGLVAPVVHFGRSDSPVSKGQGAYWRFELFLRQLESDLGILATASGSALAVRRSLYRPIPPQYGDDCVIPLDVRLSGHAVVQDSEAVVYDEMPHSVEGELRTRVRMTARNWTGILHRRALLNPFRFPGTAWSLFSHKFLRWLTPFFLAAAFLGNGFLALRGHLIFLFALQSCFYVAAGVGWRRSRSQPCERVFGYPFAFCLANLGFLLGVVRGLRRERVVAYK